MTLKDCLSIASITIGGIKDGEFVPIAFYKFPTLSIIGDNEWNTYDNNGLTFANRSVGSGGRWNPNLDLIRVIPSERAYFKFTLAEDNETP